jgi:hypothetical protein
VWLDSAHSECGAETYALPLKTTNVPGKIDGDIANFGLSVTKRLFKRRLDENFACTWDVP